MFTKCTVAQAHTLSFFYFQPFVVPQLMFEFIVQARKVCRILDVVDHCQNGPTDKSPLKLVARFGIDRLRPWTYIYSCKNPSCSSNDEDDHYSSNPSSYSPSNIVFSLHSSVCDIKLLRNPFPGLRKSPKH